MITGRGIITGRNQGKTPHDPLTIGSDAEHTLLAQVLSGADAAATQKGHIKLAGELAGTAALPTVVSTHAGSAHHAAVTLGAGAAELTLSGQQLTLAEVLTPTEHTNIGDGSPHHAAITLKTGHDAALAISGQELDLADVLTPTEHTAIGNNAPHHAQGTDTTLGTMAADVAMGTHKLTGLSVPVNAGDSVRTTAKITEVLLEDAADAYVKLNKQTIDIDYTLSPNYNGSMVGPITVADGKTLTISDGSILVVL